MTGDDRPTAPPVRLSAEAELARDALASPLLSRAARLARWADGGVRVGAGGELPDERLAEAAALLGLDGDDEEAREHAARAWDLAVDTGLLEIREDDGDGGDANPDAADGGEGDGTTGTAAPGEELALLTGGGPADVLDIWLGGLEAVLADAATPGLEDLVGELGIGEDGRIDPDSLDLEALDWDPEEEADFLAGALANLYLLTAGEPAVAAGAMVPLPVLAASMVVPEDMDHPTDDVLEEVSAVMVRLDEQFRMLEQTGLLVHHPMDEALVDEVDGDAPGEPAARDGSPDASGVPEEDEVARYGMVRLTPLGVYGVRRRMLEAGVHAPAVGDLAQEDARTLLAALPDHGEEAARAEIEMWLARRTPPDAARELLAAARGDDRRAPRRRLACQQALSLVGTEAEPALREVLDDGQLGGLARVWLSERGLDDVPAPSEEMVFWLTVDTLAAQLATEEGGDDSEELRDLVRGLVDQHSGFFDKAWRVDHPATGEVLEAMSRVHPDRQAAKDARKAAYRARSRG